MFHSASESKIILQNWWYTTLLNAKTSFCEPLKGAVSCDVLVVGAGMAGLHAALRLAEAGKKVVLIERNICGGSSTGKSAGFLTPDSELELHQLVRRYGAKDAKVVWGMASEGIELIVGNIKRFGIECDLLVQDSLFLGIGRSGLRAVREEEKFRRQVGFPSEVYVGESLRAFNPGHGYTAGIRYKDTYGINPLLYAQGLKKVLLEKGVAIYEGTPIVGISGHTAKTHMGSVDAQNIILCVDKLPSSLSMYADQVYHAQTFLSISEPLDEWEITQLFPGGQFMCWDSKLVYSYYRLTGDRRLLLGGGSAITTFLPTDVTTPVVIGSVIREFKRRFPFLAEHEFIQYWPGRIDTTKDLVPIVDSDPASPFVQYVLGCVVLPWATFCGDYAARRILDPALNTHGKYLRVNRQFLIPRWVQKIAGKMLTFSFNNFYSKYLQRDVRETAGVDVVS